MSKITIIEGNSDDKDQVRNYMVKGEKGADGVSPTVEISKTGGVTTITITDAEGPQTATINDGIDGEDGVSPTITSSKVGSTTTLTIVDAEGTHTATINDGATANIIDSTTLSDNTTETYSGRIIDEKLDNVFPKVVTIEGTWGANSSSITFDLPTGYNSSNFTVLNVYLGANHSLVYSTSDGFIFPSNWLVNSSNKLIVYLDKTASSYPSSSTTVYAELLKTS